MKSIKNSILLMSGMMLLTVLAACVTINVYFPEAAAEEAADRFIEGVIGPEMQDPRETGMFLQKDKNAASYVAAFAVGAADFVLPAAHAQVDIDINTPAVRAIQDKMSNRFEQTLRAHFDTGAIGFTNDARIAIRDLSAVSLRDRSSLQAAVADDNNDRVAVYREVAVANGHPEWTDQIRATFAERWVKNARPGWYYQNAQGDWVQK